MEYPLCDSTSFFRDELVNLTILLHKCIQTKRLVIEITTLFFLKKDENVLRFVLRGELLERERVLGEKQFLRYL